MVNLSPVEHWLTCGFLFFTGKVYKLLYFILALVNYDITGIYK